MSGPKSNGENRAGKDGEVAAGAVDWRRRAVLEVARETDRRAAAAERSILIVIFVVTASVVVVGLEVRFFLLGRRIITTKAQRPILYKQQKKCQQKITKSAGTVRFVLLYCMVLSMML